MALFLGFVVCFQLEAYTSHWGEFAGLMACFGIALINFTYFFSNFFTTQNGAFKTAAQLYILAGVGLPMGLIGVMLAVEVGWMITIIFYVCFVLDPLFTFFTSIWYFVYVGSLGLKWPDKKIPIRPDTTTGCLVMASQGIFFFIVN